MQHLNHSDIAIHTWVSNVERTLNTSVKNIKYHEAQKYGLDLSATLKIE